MFSRSLWPQPPWQPLVSDCFPWGLDAECPTPSLGLLPGSARVLARKCPRRKLGPRTEVQRKELHSSVFSCLAVSRIVSVLDVSNVGYGSGFTICRKDK